ncbi:toxin ParE1/3/4 [Neorhizobium galegae]|uniref:type II toxin-antitoxin system RelE/ParE family toxin n=1 Tax=Neorhizobium galegae TaxID=399 RepID=UPI001AE22A3E|nr:toxin ParE1/3/4 [Neorhizobium galegae]
MTHKVTFSPETVADFKDLYDYLLPRAGAMDAERYVADIYAYCLGFATFPERGRRRKERNGLRTVGYRRHATIAFQVHDDTVTIIRLFHRGRQIDLSEP